MLPTKRPDVGAQIRKARSAIGLTQIEAAALLNVAERTYQAWEGNARTPRLDGLTLLAEHFKQPVSFFYGDEDVTAPEDIAA